MFQIYVHLNEIRILWYVPLFYTMNYSEKESNYKVVFEVHVM